MILKRMDQILIHRNQHDQYQNKYDSACRHNIYMYLKTKVLLQLSICVHEHIIMNDIMKPKKEDYLLDYLLQNPYYFSEVGP